MKTLTAFLITIAACLVSLPAWAQAEIKFDETTHDFGSFPESDAVKECVFTFTNVGNQPLVIHQAVPSCGCTVPEFSQEAVLPGEQGTVKVTYNGRGKYPGPFKKTVTLRTNAKTEMLRLIIKGVMTEDGATTDSTEVAATL